MAKKLRTYKQIIARKKKWANKKHLSGKQFNAYTFGSTSHQIKTRRKGRRK